MPRPFRLEIWITLGLLLLASIAALREPYLLVALRENVFDAYQRLRPRIYQPLPVRIVDIDDESLSRLGQWPWPRYRLGDLVMRLKQQGAAAIVFDMLFPEPDRTAPAQLLSRWPELADLPRARDRLADYDAMFASALRGSPSVTGFALVGHDSPAQPRRSAGFAVIGGDPLPFLLSFPGAVVSLPALEQAASGHGALNVEVAAGGVIRRVPLLMRLRETIYPSLAAEALRVAQGADTYVIKMAGAAGEESFGAKTGLTHLRIGRLTIPTDRNGGVWIYYTEPQPQRFIPAWQLLDGTADAAAIDGAIIIIGSTAVGLQDLHATPLATAYPGVAVHAEIIEQALLGVHLVRPDWARGAEILLMLGLATLVLLLGPRIGAIWTAVAGGLATTAAIAASWFAFRRHGILLDPVFPAAAVLFTYAVTSLVKHFRVERQQRWIRKAFASYMSPRLVQELVDNPDHLKLHGERRTLSFLFTDLEGFTALVEQADPAVVVPAINAYLDGMIRIAFRHDGTVDKIIGDALHVMFGAPVADPHHAARAVACALEIDAFADAFAAAKRREGLPFGQTRIGVNSGTAIVGNFGGELKFDYTAHGDAINVAARLESANRHLGTRVCVSEATVALCPDFTGRPIGALLLKGKSQPIRTFEPVAHGSPAEAALGDYATAFALMEAEQPDAAQAWQALAERWPEDRLIALHMRRLARGERGSLITLAEK